MNNSKNYVQVEIPKLPRDVADMLSECQTRDYNEFKRLVWSALSKFGQYQCLLIWIESHMKIFDTALSVGAWEIDE
ncbi:hypothetical protein [Leuconostoc suionicum]|uniref:hypothetical protein n=1 Tax=Leuconostoc suionicum TaxID=1511761 RepID=UPI0032DEDD7F